MKFKNAVSFILGPAVTGLLGLVTVPYLTWQLTPTDLGQYSFFLATLSFCIAFFPLGLDQAFVREYYDVSNKNELLTTTILPSMLVFIVSYIIITAFFSVSKIIIGNAVANVELVFFASVVAGIAVRFLFLPIRMQGNGALYSLGQIIPRSVLIFYLVIVSTNEHSLTTVGLIYVWTIGLFIQLFILTIINTFSAKKFTLTFVNIDLFQKSLRYSVPLMLSSIAFWGLTLTDRVLLRTFSSFDQLGIYSVIINFASIAVMFQTVFTTIWSPLVFKWHSEGTAEQNVAYISSFALPIFLFGIFLSILIAPFLNIFLGDGYDQIAIILPLCVVPAFMYTMSEISACKLQIEKRSGLILTSVLIGLSANMFLGYFLVNYLGISGAAISTAVSFWAMYVVKIRNVVRIGGTNHMKNFSLMSFMIIFLLSIYSVVGKDQFAIVGLISLLLIFVTVFYFRLSFLALYKYVRGQS